MTICSLQTNYKAFQHVFEQGIFMLQQMNANSYDLRLAVNPDLN